MNTRPGLLLLTALTLTARPTPAAAEAPAPRRVAIVLDAAPSATEPRTHAIEAAALLVLGLAAPRETGLVEWAVVPPETKAVTAQSVDAAFATLQAWKPARKDPESGPAFVAATTWAGPGGVVVHVADDATPIDGRLAVVPGASPVEAVAPALTVIWQPEPRVTVIGPTRRFTVPPDVAQMVVLASANDAGGEGEALVAWSGEGKPPAQGRVEVAPRAGREVEFEAPALVVLSRLRVSIEGCHLQGDELPRYMVWPPTAKLTGELSFRIGGLEQGSGFAKPREGRVDLPDGLIGGFTLTPRLLSAKREIDVGPTVQCQARPTLVATPRIDVVAQGDGGQVRVSFRDLREVGVPAAQVFEAGPVAVKTSKGAEIALAVEGDVAVGALPARAAGEGLVLSIDSEVSRRRVLGSASLSLPAPARAGAGVSPWWIGLLAAVLVGGLVAAWPWASALLVARMSTGQRVSGQVTVTVRGVPLTALHVDERSIYPVLVTGLHPMPIGEGDDAPSLVRLELRRTLRGVRLFALVAEGDVLRTLSHPLDGTEWTLGDLTVSFRA